MKRVNVAVAMFAVALAGGAAAQEDLAAEGKPAPIFRLPVYNAQAVGSSVVALDKFVGPDATEPGVKVVLLSFMASFCAPCKKEMPYLQMLHQKYKDFGLRVVSVSIDTEPDGQKIIEDLIAQNKVTYPVLKDRFNLVARRWLGTQSPLPSVFMVKPDGMVSFVHRGYNQEASEVFATQIENALGIKRGAAALKVATDTSATPPNTELASDKPAADPADATQLASDKTPAEKPHKGKLKKRAPKTPAP
jgi:thiol-disulfide isomerase/thioredoxin